MTVQRDLCKQQYMYLLQIELLCCCAHTRIYSCNGSDTIPQLQTQECGAGRKEFSI